jgi:Family of unknown function (DUF6152)
MTRISIFLPTACALMLAAAPAPAHHSFSAEFDSKKPVRLEGIVSRVEFINPHVWIHLDVKGADGKVTAWMIEAGSPSVLLRRGFTKTTLTPGTQVVVMATRPRMARCAPMAAKSRCQTGARCSSALPETVHRTIKKSNDDTNPNARRMRWERHR